MKSTQSYDPLRARRKRRQAGSYGESSKRSQTASVLTIGFGLTEIAPILPQRFASGRRGRALFRDPAHNGGGGIKHWGVGRLLDFGESFHPNHCHWHWEDSSKLLRDYLPAPPHTHTLYPRSSHSESTKHFGRCAQFHIQLCRATLR